MKTHFLGLLLTTILVFATVWADEVLIHQPDEGSLTVLDSSSKLRASSVPPATAASLPESVSVPLSIPLSIPASSPQVSHEAPPKTKNDYSAAQNLLLSALSLIGVQYKWGGNTPQSGLDCSGFVRYVFQHSLQIALPRSALGMSKLGKNIDKAALKPGDLVFFNTLRRQFSHVGIYLGDNRFIHSPRKGRSVEVSSMNKAYWATRYSGARRVSDTLDSSLAFEKRLPLPGHNKINVVASDFSHPRNRKKIYSTIRKSGKVIQRGIYKTKPVTTQVQNVVQKSPMRHKPITTKNKSITQHNMTHLQTNKKRIQTDSKSKKQTAQKSTRASSVLSQGKPVSKKGSVISTPQAVTKKPLRNQL